MFLVKRGIKKEDKELLKFLRNILGCKPKNISIYKLSLVHKSCSIKDSKGNKLNNERLEYLGDTVLSTIVGEFLFKKYPLKGEGFLTEMRSKIVSRASLNKLSVKIGLSNLIEYNRGAHSSSFGSVNGDAFEALVGAIYLDRGYNFTYKILTKKILSIHLDIDELENTTWNYKSKIIDWCQKNRKKISFEVVESKLINHRMHYIVQILIDEQPQEQAEDYSIKAAEQLAAEKTLKKILENEQQHSTQTRMVED